MTRHLVVVCALPFVLAASAVCPAQEGFQNLVRVVPDRANTLVLFNVEKIHESPVAQREGWKQRHIKSFEAGLVKLPPDTLRFVMSAQMDLEYMEPIWEVAVYHLDRHLTLAAIAEKLDGKPDRFGDVKALALPSGAYLALFDDATGATHVPGNRQMVGRWLARAFPRTKPELSPYLTAALGYADIVGSPIIMAIDMTHAISPNHIRERLQESQVIKSYNADVDQVTEILASIQGVTLGITLKEQPFGRIKVDFGQDAIPLGGFAKPLLLEVLRNQGAMVDDFINWQGKIVGKQVSLSGYLTEDGMRRIFSLVEAPNPNMHSDAQESVDQNTQIDPKAKTSLTYFREVSSLIDDVRGKGAQTQGQAAMFFDKYARKIEQFPMLGVDNDMLDYGAYVASQFRQASGALRGAAIGSRERQVNLPNFSKTFVRGDVIGATRWRTHGVYSWSTFEDRARKQQARTQVRTQERLKGNAAVLQIFADLDNLTAEARRAMTQRYNVQF